MHWLMRKPTFRTLETEMQNLTHLDTSTRAAYAQSLVAVLRAALENETPPENADIDAALFVVGELLSTKQD